MRAKHLAVGVPLCLAVIGFSVAFVSAQERGAREPLPGPVRHFVSPRSSFEPVAAVYGEGYVFIVRGNMIYKINARTLVKEGELEYCQDVAARAEGLAPMIDANLKVRLQDLRRAIALFQAQCGVYPLRLEDLMAVKAPAKGIAPQTHAEREIKPADYAGPYLNTPDGKLPMDPVTGKRDWRYDPKTGTVHSNAAGRAADGSAYRNM